MKALGCPVWFFDTFLIYVLVISKLVALPTIFALLNLLATLNQDMTLSRLHAVKHYVYQNALMPLLRFCWNILKFIYTDGNI